MYNMSINPVTISSVMDFFLIVSYDSFYCSLMQPKYFPFYCISGSQSGVCEVGCNTVQSGKSLPTSVLCAVSMLMVCYISYFSTLNVELKRSFETSLEFDRNMQRCD
jgi:hypothetical protein